jgi:hypothetical protein
MIPQPSLHALQLRPLNEIEVGIRKTKHVSTSIAKISAILSYVSKSLFGILLISILEVTFG